MSLSGKKPTRTDTDAVLLIAQHLRTLNPRLRFDERAASERIFTFAKRAGIATDQIIQFLYEVGDGVSLWDARDTMGHQESAQELRADVYGVIP